VLPDKEKNDSCDDVESRNKEEQRPPCRLTRISEPRNCQTESCINSRDENPSEVHVTGDQSRDKQPQPDRNESKHGE
jgi:hypothetical protein